MTDLDQLRIKLNQETGCLRFAELARFFARGSVMVVSANRDLVEIAVRMATDDTVYLKPLLESGDLRSATDEDARRWQQRDGELWAVVVAPWIMVQETGQD